MKEAAELAVRVPSAGLELDLEYQVVQVFRGPVGTPSIGEEPNPVPSDRINAVFGEHRGKGSDTVPALPHAQPVDLMVGVEGSDGGLPVPGERGANSQHLDILRDDRYQAASGHKAGSGSSAVDRGSPGT